MSDKLTDRQIENVISYLEDCFPDGAEPQEINDLIWWDFDSILEAIGVPSEAEVAEGFLEENEDELLDILREGVRLPESKGVVKKILELGDDVESDDLSELFDVSSLGKKLEEKVKEAIEDEGLVRESNESDVTEILLDWFNDHIVDVLEELEEE